MILDTKNASRYPLLAGGTALILVAFVPELVALIGSVPAIITGCLLIFIMTGQFSAALGILMENTKEEIFTFENGIVIGFSVIIAATFSFLPETAVTMIPAIVRPVLANGFVAGTLAVMILEHLVFRKRSNA
jgi:xanthine/uracil permease